MNLHPEKSTFILGHNEKSDLSINGCTCGIGRQSGADAGFLERGFICIKVWGFDVLVLSHFSSIFHENEIIWSH